jgi:hypothetical protein
MSNHTKAQFRFGFIAPVFALIFLGFTASASGQESNVTSDANPHNLVTSPSQVSVNARELRTLNSFGLRPPPVRYRVGQWLFPSLLKLSSNAKRASLASFDPYNSSAGYISQSNPWSTADSAFFPNGITTAGATNWIYGSTTFIGNAPSNGFGHEFRAANGSSDALLAIGGGAVGIGTISPTTTLSVKGVGHFYPSGTTPDDAYKGSLRITQPTASGQYINMIRSGQYPWSIGTVYNSSSFAIGLGQTTDSNFTGTNIRLAIDTAGNVGLGTTTPSFPLQVSRSASDQYLGWFENTQSSPGLARLRVQNTATQGSFEIDVNTDGNTLFQTGKSNNSPSLSILTGNVGIGTMSPANKLDVNGSVSSNSNVVLSADAGKLVFSNDATNYYLGNNGSTYGVQGNAYYGWNFFTHGVNSMGLRIDGSGYVGIGKTNPTAALDVQGDVKVSGSIAAKYQDVAEWVDASEQLTAGSVVVLDSTKSNQVTSSSVSYDTRVAGVVSEQPGIALGERSENKILVATTGRVKVKVDASNGAIHIGDLLVTSDVPGMAMKSEPIVIGGRQIHAPGTLIGKALEPLEKGKGEILVLLSLQ